MRWQSASQFKICSVKAQRRPRRPKPRGLRAPSPRDRDARDPHARDPHAATASLLHREAEQRGGKILQQQSKASKRPNNRPTNFGPSAFHSSTVPSGYEVKDCPVQVDASNCLYLHPDKDDPLTGEPASWSMVANFCIESCVMLLKWMDGDKAKAGIEIVLTERLIKVP